MSQASSTTFFNNVRDEISVECLKIPKISAIFIYERFLLNLIEISEASY